MKHAAKLLNSTGASGALFSSLLISLFSSPKMRRLAICCGNLRVWLDWQTVTLGTIPRIN